MRAQLIRLFAILLLCTSVTLALEGEASVGAYANVGTHLVNELTEKSLFLIKSKVGLKAEAAASAIPTSPEKVAKLPELPGSELIGVGVNLREGVGMEAMTRPLFKPRSWTAFAADESLFYRIPSFEVGRRNFRADMSTKVYSSNQERLTDLAVSAGVEFSAGMFSGSAEAHVSITKQNNKKTVISQASLDVDLYDLGITRYTAADLDPNLLDDWNALPEMWTEGPMQFQDFVKKWGTHYAKTAEIGGAFQMIGTTTTSLDVDNLAVAANVKISLEAAVKISAKGNVDYKSKNLKEEYQNNFDFHSIGGDPAVGALLASSHQAAKPDGKMEDACMVWLQSLKKTPSLRTLKLGYIFDLFGGIGGNSTSRRQMAMKQAVDIYLREGDSNSNVINLQEGSVKFSNFWRVLDQCLNFQAVVGPGNTLRVHLTSSSIRNDVGYTVEVDPYKANIFKAGKLVATTSSMASVTPGSNTLYASYIVCYDSKAGTILYGRNRRVVFAYKDPNPDLVYFYGFSVKGGNSASLTALTVFNVAELTCPFHQGQLCGGSDRGACNEFKMCQCTDAFRGYACQRECPLGGENSTICSSNGQCKIDEALGDDAIPFCDCKSGSLGKACDIAELPKLTIHTNPKGPEGQLLSGRPITFSLKRSSSDPRAAKVLPVDTQFTFEAADADTVVVKAPVAYQTLTPGRIIVTASITLPHNPDIVRVSKTFSVVDCACSGRGRCDSQTGQCLCRAGASGANCEEDVINGILTVEETDVSSQTVTGSYIRRFGRIPKSVEVTLYETPETGSYNVTLMSFNDQKLTVNVIRSDSQKGWDSPIRVMYRAVGARFVGEATGTATFPAADGQPTRTVSVRFPQQYHETPFVFAEVSDLVKNTGFHVRVARASTQGAVLEISREQGKWDQPIDAKWTARPYGVKDIYQSGELSIGSRLKGPAPFIINFPQVFRQWPKVDLVPKSFNGKTDAFDIRVNEITNGFVRAEVALISDENAEAGWEQSLVIGWEAYPPGFDKRTIVKSIPPRNVFDGYEMLGSDLGQPIQLTGKDADVKGCATACKQNPNCKGYSFRKTTKDCLGDWNSGNGDQAPYLLAVGTDGSMMVMPAAGGKFVKLPSYNKFIKLSKVILLRDGRLIGVETSHGYLVTRRSLNDDWTVIPASHCMRSIAELPDGRLVGVHCNMYLYVKASSSLTSDWIPVTVPGASGVDGGNRNAKGRDENDGLVEINSEVKSESASLAESEDSSAMESTNSRPDGVSGGGINYQYFDIAVLQDGTVYGLAYPNYQMMIIFRDSGWQNIQAVYTWGDSGFRSITAGPDGGMFGISQSSQMFWFDGRPGTARLIPNSNGVAFVVGHFYQLSRGLISEQPGRCYLKTHTPTLGLAPNKCAITGGIASPVPAFVSYNVRVTGWGGACVSATEIGDGGKNAAKIVVNDKIQPLVPGINVYLVHSTGAVEYANSASIAAMQALVKRIEGSPAKGLVGVIVACQTSCTGIQWESSNSAIVDRAGWTARVLAHTLSQTAGLFIKDLINNKVHADLAGIYQSCSILQRSGSFPISAVKKK